LIEVDVRLMVFDLFFEKMEMFLLVV